MIIQKLNVYQFKNHPERQFTFSPQINCFVGNNGVGKTNILDALHYLSVGKSFLGNTDGQNVQYDALFFNIEAKIQTSDKEDIIKILYNKEGKKTIKKNEKTYDRMADHVGYLPSVIISPYDSNLISDSGESRRRFLDAMISQTDAEYLHSLVSYTKAIQQRNALLKYFAKNRTYDQASLDIYTLPLAQYGSIIFAKRKEFIEQLSPIVESFYQIISGGKESIEVKYQSQLLDQPNGGTLHEQFEALLKTNLEKDRALTYTSAGVHKDDLIFEMQHSLIKKIGSQGQQKSFLIALKLAQINRIKTLTGKTPILLLDDIFDKLDDQRVSQLIELLNRENFGQIFITDTHRERTESVVKRINEESIIFEL